jgi:hypothetical protein
MNAPHATAALATSHRMRRLGHLDLPGGGQVVVQGTRAFVGHMQPPYGTTVLDVSDPRAPRIIAQIKLDDEYSHTHKVRVVGDVMYTNVEQNNRRAVRKAARIPEARAALEAELKRPPTAAELAARLQVKEDDIAPLEALHRRGYGEGGFKIWDIRDVTRPRLITHQKTGGVGVHRFDVDQKYAYISTEMEGYVGNILVIYDVRDPAKPEEVSRWWMPGQHLAGGEQPLWEGQDWRLHHTLRHEDKLYAGCWQGGVRVIDVADIAKPRTVASYNYHPLYAEPSHTFFRVPFAVGGRQIALVTDEQHDHHHRGQPRAGLWVFDVEDLAHIHPIAQFHVSELDSPYTRNKGRFGCHQFQEHLEDTYVFCTWFSGGVRVIDIRNPTQPEEVGWYIPDPCGDYPSPQSNDVDVDSRGLIYVLDRNAGFDILEFERP